MAHDVVVVGSGPNGLTAACVLAKSGLDVRVVEAGPEIGGGTRTAELTLPGFLHDVCSGVHTLGCLSPVFRALELTDDGLEWRSPEFSAAHPLEGGQVALLETSVTATARRLGTDEAAYRRLLGPFERVGEDFFADALSPLWRLPKAVWPTWRFRLLGLPSVSRLARRFADAPARALLAGCAAHSILGFDQWLTGGVGLMFLIAGHARAWPVALGGSRAIAQALLRVLDRHGGTVELGTTVADLAELPAARAYVFDLAPRQLARIARDALPPGYVRRLERFRPGPGVFKLDWALDGPIPWRAADCLRASTVHVGGTFEEVAAAEAQVMRGQHPEAPFVLVCQQSQFDETRAPAGKHTGYAYCHVPSGSTVDMTDAIESQIERFAPGFRQRILARHVLTPAGLQEHNASAIGGAITGGAMDLWQLVARPAFRLDPYATPNPKLFLCSHSTPPGGGVHGMCGYHAARSVLRRLGKAAAL